MMDGAPGDIVLPGGIEQPEAVIEAPAVIGEIEQPVNVIPNAFATITWYANSLPLSEVIVLSNPLYGRRVVLQFEISST